MKIKKIAALCLAFTLLFTTTAGGAAYTERSRPDTGSYDGSSRRPTIFHKILLILPFADRLYDLFDDFYLLGELFKRDNGLHSKYGLQEAFDKNQAAYEELSKERKALLSNYEQLAFFGFFEQMNLGLVFICSMNQETGEASLVLLPPDFTVQNRMGRETSLKEVYAEEGITEAVWALNNRLKLDLSDVITFDEHAIINGVNAMGGADLTLSSQEFYYINGYITVMVKSTQVASKHVSKQDVRMDGVQMAAYLDMLYTIYADLKDTDDTTALPQDSGDSYILSDSREGACEAVSQGMEKAFQSLQAALGSADLFAYLEIARTVIPQINCSFGDGSVSSLQEKFGGFYLGDIMILMEPAGTGTESEEADNQEPASTGAESEETDNQEADNQEPGNIGSEYEGLEDIDQFLFGES